MGTKFTEQVAVITGAASGLGAEIAVRLSSMGIKHLALFDRDAEGLERVRKTLTTGAAAYALDITSEADVASAIAKVAAGFGRIDILINCAGITGRTNILSHDVSLEDLRRVFDVNLVGSFLTSKYVLPLMVENKFGRILHIASISGKEGNAGMLAYSASKAAVIGMTKVQGKEYAEMGITVNALAPAVIQTAMVDALPAETVKYMTDKIPMKRCGQLEEAASIAAFIVSPECSFTTGFTFDLSGGRATY
ncbi:MAG: SDR family NAD(P)-dependent oxidoreductase [Daejeonella sp.]|uniref:SDR family NAD(P)-dependent oxidoreductase n=1 Tax=Daejeonella sp. JGW-45 TaxID=3034148 RepID=UPI0023ECC34E|nr:SDR family NAD(P)-dependent oxidoreductase [Daejeonella sp. JGW-45]